MSEISDLLSTIFDQLNRSGITYCVLRNYENYPRVVGHDVDFWVLEEDQERFQQTVVESARIAGWEFVRYAPWWSNKGQGRYYFIKQSNQLHVLHIDCFVHIHWRGLFYIDQEAIAELLTFHENGFYIPSPSVEVSTMLFPRLLSEGNVRVKERGRIKECVINSDGFEAAISKPFGKGTTEQIVETIKTENWESLEKMGKSLRWVMIRQALLTKPLSQLLQWAKYLWSRFKEHYFQDYGLFLVLLGPDGSGKTSTAKAILESSGIKQLFQIKAYYHARFNKIPELKAIPSFLKLRKPVKQTNQKNPPTFSHEELGVFGAMMYPLYYALDYLLGHAIIRRIRAYFSIAVMDRYFYDYWVQKRHNRCPRWLLSILGRIIPKPDVTIYLNSDPEIIHARKKDLPLSEIERQVQLCRELIPKMPNGHSVDASVDLDGVVDQIERIILEAVRAKWERSKEFRLFNDHDVPVVQRISKTK